MLQARLILVLAAAIATPAIAQFKPIDGHIKVSREAVDLQYEERLKTLHKEALALQNSDGGALTPEHRAILQSKLDRLNSDYRLARKNTDPWNVNADGSRRY